MNRRFGFIALVLFLLIPSTALAIAPGLVKISTVDGTTNAWVSSIRVSNGLLAISNGVATISSAGDYTGLSALPGAANRTPISTNGTTATWQDIVDLTTSSQLISALTDETGTGYAVFNNSSSLITPAITIAEVDGHASGNLTAANVSNTIIHNYNMGAADVALVLPTAAAGYSALFHVTTAQANKWGVRAGTNDKITIIAADGTVAAGSDNGYARMTAAQVGQEFACWTTKTDNTTWDWSCKAIAIGTSTFAAN